MYLRDVLVSVVLLASLPLSFRTPWFGVIVYSWIGYMNPHKLTWGFASNKPWAFMAIIATTAGVILGREQKSFPITRDTVLLGILWIVFVFSTLTSALYPEEAWAALEKVSKILFGTVVTLVVMKDQRRLRFLIWTLTLSIGFYGVKGGLFAIATGGQYQVLGPQSSFIAGNTEIGLALTMVLPFLWLLRHDVKRIWLRLLLAVASVLTVVAILATYSRGALLGIVAVLLVLIAKSRSRVLAIGLLGSVLLVTATVMPDSWIERMNTITGYEEDGSAMGRINAWKLAWRIAMDRPLLGAGFQPFTHEVYARYLTENPSRSADAHNIFFQVLAEHGFIGLIVFATLIGSTLATLGRVQRRTWRSTHLQSLGLYAQMTEASLVGYLVGGFFLSRSYFDLFYHLVAITILLETLLRAAERTAAKSTASPGTCSDAPPRGLEPMYGRV